MERQLSSSAAAFLMLCPISGGWGSGSKEFALNPGRLCDGLFQCREIYWGYKLVYIGGDALRIYVDVIFVLNFAVDFLLIQGTNRLAGYPEEYRRGIGASVLGGIYGTVCVLPGWHFLGSGLWRTVFLLLMGIIAFGWNRSAIQRISVFLILSMALGGIASGSSADHVFGLILCGCFLFLLCRMGFFRGIGKEVYIPVKLCWRGRCMDIYALRDTGNVLRDPLTGEQVLVCGADVGEALLGLPRNCFRDPVGTMMQGLIPGLRMIPYHSVGNPGGMLLVVRMDEVIVAGAKSTPLVAFAPEEIAKGEVYRMLTGGTI